MPVELIRRGGKVDVVLDGAVVARVEPGAPAQQLAQWIRYQVGAGADGDAIRSMLRGEVTGSDDVDLSVLEGSVKAVKEALDTGVHDAHIDALTEAERVGKDRKGVMTALAARAGG